MIPLWSKKQTSIFVCLSSVTDDIVFTNEGNSIDICMRPWPVWHFDINEFMWDAVTLVQKFYRQTSYMSYGHYAQYRTFICFSHSLFMFLKWYAWRSNNLSLQLYNTKFFRLFFNLTNNYSAHYFVRSCLEGMW